MNRSTQVFYNGKPVSSGNPLPVSGAIPSGVIMAYGAASAPTGWLNCDGSAVSRTTYSALFAIIGTTYGTGNGSTTFNLPDLVGAVPRGSGTSTGYTQNVTITLGTKQNDAIQGHKHDSVSKPWTTTSADFAYGVNWNLLSGDSGNPVSDGTNGTPRTANETRVKNVGVNFIIKT